MYLVYLLDCSLGTDENFACLEYLRKALPLHFPLDLLAMCRIIAVVVFYNNSSEVGLSVEINKYKVNEQIGCRPHIALQ